jgi:hypothetical protein
MRSAWTRAHPVSDKPLDLDKHRGMAAQKATDIRRILADAENNAKNLRERQRVLENELLSAPAASWPEAAARARYVFYTPRSWLLPTPITAIWWRSCLRTSPGSRMRAERIVARRTTKNLPRPSEIECPPESTRHAKSFAASRQNRRVAPARRRIGLVQHKSERNVCLGAA